MANEKANAQTAMTPMPTNTKSVARNCEADMTKWPMPRVAAMSSAATSVLHPTPNAIRIPVGISGRAD